MDRRQRRPLNAELRSLEQELAALTLRVAAIRNQVTTEDDTPHTPSIGDRVRFYLVGTIQAEGIIIGTTAHRVRIRQDRTGHIILRAPHNVTLLPSNND
jgi:hypothetical protein